MPAHSSSVRTCGRANANALVQRWLGRGAGETFGGNYNAVGAQTNQGTTASYGDTQFVNLPANVAAERACGAALSGVTETVAAALT